MSFFPTPERHAFDIAMMYSSRTSICPCLKRITCEIGHRQPTLMSHDYVMVKGEIKRNAPTCQDKFREKFFLSSRCAHDLESLVTIKVTTDQWQQVISKSNMFMVLDGIVSNGVIDTTSEVSGVMACPEARVKSPGNDVVTCEAFSGGYSGWSQAMRRLSEVGYPFAHRVAVDQDEICAETFMRSHGFQHRVGPLSYVWGTEPLPDHLFVVGDMMSHGWKHLLSNVSYDLLVMSPPCPPWSLASLQQALAKMEGRLTLHAWGLAHVLQPRVVLMEMVSGMKNHDDWKVVRDFIRWAGFSIRFARTANLSEIAPQHRDRFIVIATLDSADLFPHLPATWPPMQRQTLETFLNIINIDEPWLSQCKLNEDLLRIYMDPKLLPKALDQRGHDLKRSRKDVEQYRVKHPHGVFGCIMSNYSYGHLLPDATLQHAGLYGTLLALPTGLRFMSIPEILIAQMTCMPCWLPKSHRDCIRMLGNSISIPHALLGLTNALAFLFELSGVEARELMVQVMNRRMTSRNIQWEERWGGISFTIDDDACQPTMLMHAEQTITLRSPMDVVTAHVERDVNVLAALKALLGHSLPNEIFLLPGDDLNSRVLLQPQMIVGDNDIHLFASVPSALDIHLKAFSSLESKAQEIVVLTKWGAYVVRRDHGMTVADVITVVDHSFGIRCTHLTGSLGERHPEQMICPDAVFAMDIEGASDDLSILEFLDIKIDVEGIRFCGTFNVISEFFDFLHKTALIDVIQSLGWLLVVDLQHVVDRCVTAVRLVRRPSALSIVQDELVYCIAIHMFLVKIRTWTTVGAQPAVRCRIKLWHAWVWDSLIDPSTTLEKFDEAWNSISEKLQIDKPWRFVINNRCVNPEWPLTSFVQHDEHGDPQLSVFLLLGVRGGGPARLMTSQQALHSENFQNMAHLEAQNFESALTVALRMMFGSDASHRRFDISDFLEIDSSIREGLFTLKGGSQILYRFLVMMHETGMESMFRRCGWMPACVFTRLDDPQEFHVVFVALPQVPTVTLEFVRTLLKSALACLGMPTPTSGDDDVFTKEKLWNVLAFKGKLPRMFPMQQFLDVWDQACTIAGEHHTMRLVSHIGMVNPDFALKHFSRCGPDAMSCAVITFVGALRGGGPGSDKGPANFHDLNIQQKNAMASFLLSQGADLKECVNFIESLVKNAGANAISTILGQKRINKKWEGIAQLAQALHIEMPQIAKKLQLARSKAQKKFQTQARSQPANLPVENLVMENGYLLNQDDTNCLQLQKIAPNVSGAVLMRYDEAKQWLERKIVLSQDELVIIVVGACGHEESDKCHKIQVPVLMNNEPLIVQGCLHQLGAKHAKIPSDDENIIPETETQVMCFTAVKDDVPRDVWDALLQAPVKHMLRLLGDDASDVVFVSPPWGRSFQKAAKKVSPDVATTVQFHCRVRRSDVRALLRASGNGGIYICPKTEDKQVSTEYMVVWTKANAVDLAVSLSQCENHFGLVRSLKGDNQSKGIRFARQDFPAAFAKLRPDEDIPNVVSHNHFFRVEPTPLGTSADQIQAWIEAHGWKAKPVRSINASTWLCVAEKKFDDVFLQWNNKPVLVKWIQQKKDKQPVVLAGNVQKVFQTPPPEALTDSATEATSHQNDPWGTWIKNHGGSGLSHASSAVRPSPSHQIAAQPPRRVEAPIEDKFQRRDEQMQLIREVTEKEIMSLKESVQMLERAVEDQRGVIDQNLEFTTTELRALKADTTQQFQSMADIFRESLSTAIAAHDGAMNEQFNEIKALIAAAPSAVSPPPKKHKNSAPAENEHSFPR